jgi:hypothetical protein
MNRPSPFAFAAYRSALQLYPSHLRLRYQEQMLQTVRDAHAERASSAPIFWLRIFLDLLKSSLREHLDMVRKQVFARPTFFYTLTLAVVLTVLGFCAAIVMQQMLRRGADQPQIQMAAAYAGQLASGQASTHSIPDGRVDLSSSLEPFVIFYNSDGTPVRSSGYLGDAVPTPPAGIFAYLRTNAIDKFTWQPRRGVRIAAVAQRVDGAHPGFILVGRSLTLVEQQEDLLRKATFITWVCLMALLLAGAALLNRAHSPTPAAAT